MYHTLVLKEGPRLCLNLALCPIPTRANRARMKFMSTARCLRGHIPGYPTQLSGMSLTSAPPPPGGLRSICRIKSGESGRSLVAFHASSPTLHTLPLMAHTQGMSHYEQAHGILAEHVCQYAESYASAHTAPREEFAQGVKHSGKGVKHPHGSSGLS